MSIDKTLANFDESVANMKKSVLAEIATANKKAGLSDMRLYTLKDFEVPQRKDYPYKPYEAILKKYYYYNSYGSRGWEWRGPLASIVEEVDAIYTAMLAYVPDHKAKHDHNEKIITGLIDTFKAIGLRETEWENVRVRGKNKSVERAAGWLISLSKLRVAYNTADALKRERNEFLRSPMEYFAGLAKAEAERKAAAEAEEKARKARREADTRRIALIMALSLEPGASNEDIFEAALRANKYFALAYYLQKNRNDYTDGWHYAEVGLTYFKALTPTERKIENAVRYYLDAEFDNDATCFRDDETCGYDKLFEIAATKPFYKECLEAMTLVGTED